VDQMHDYKMIKILSLSLLIISTLILYCNIPSIVAELGIMPITTTNKLLPALVVD
jgi:hypothetical protein